MLWGLSFIIIKVGLENTTPIFFGFLRYSMASVFFIILLAYKKFSKKGIKMFALLGLISISIPVAMQNIGLKFTSAYISGFLQSTGPLYTLILASVFLNEKITFNKTMGITISFIGTYLIAAPESGGNLYGNLLILFSAIFYSVGSVIAKKLLKNYEPLQIISFATIFGTIFLFPFSFTEKIEFNQTILIYSLILAIFPTFLSYILWYTAMKKMEVSKLSCYIYLIPFFSTIFSYIFLNEGIKILTLVYGIIIIAGVAIAQKA